MDKIAFQIGPFAIRWYAILLNLGLLAGAFYAYYESKRQGDDPEFIVDILIWGIPAGVIGARLYYVLFSSPLYYFANPTEIYKIWHGGLAIHGALIGGVTAGYLVCRKHQQSFLHWADIAAPGIILAQAIGRWGNFVNQEAYGYVTDVPWAMYIDGAYRHPTFLYESLWNMLVFALLVYWQRKQQRFSGEIIALYVLGYSAGRIWIEGLRTDSLMIGPLRIAQVMSGVGILASALFIYNKRKKGSRH